MLSIILAVESAIHCRNSGRTADKGGSDRKIAADMPVFVVTVMDDGVVWLLAQAVITLLLTYRRNVFRSVNQARK